MTSPVVNQMISRVEAMFANGVAWTAPSNVLATAWELPAFHLLWSDEVASESEIRRLWDDRKGRQAFSVVLLAPAENPGNVRVAGPQDARPVRELPVRASTRTAASCLLDGSPPGSVFPGQGVQPA